MRDLVSVRLSPSIQRWVREGPRVETRCCTEESLR